MDNSKFQPLTCFNALCQAAKACQQVFLHKEAAQLEQCIDQLIAAQKNLLALNPHLALSLLNVQHYKLDYLSNLIIKTSLTTFVVSHLCQFNQKTNFSLVKANLLILYAITPSILKLKQQPKLLAKLRANLTKSALLCFKRIHNADIQDQDALRVLSQLAGVNEFKQTNQLAQSVCILSLNSSVLSLPFLPFTTETASTSFSRSLTTPLLLSPKPFFKQYGGRIFNLVTKLLLTGSIVRLNNNKFACLISQLDNKKWLSFVFTAAKINDSAALIELKTEQLAFAYPQQKINVEHLLNLYQIHNRELAEYPLSPLQIELETSQFYQPQLDFKKTSNLLLSEHSKNITAFLLTEPRQSALLLEYASSNNRQQQKIYQISHAVALLGMVRLFPVIANGDIQICQEKDKYLGSSQVMERARQFSLIAAQLSQKTNTDVPEYCQLLANILFLGLITIPRAKYAAAAHNRPTQSPLHLAQLFQLNESSNWHKTSNNLAVRWHLPMPYRSAITAHFDVLQDKTEMRHLPKSTAKLVALLLVSQYLFIEFNAGSLKPTKLEQLNTSLNVLSLGNREVMEFYDQLIDDVTPFTSLV